MPFKTVENEGFKHLMQTVCPLYQIPSRNTIRRRIDGKFKCKFKESLSKVKYIAETTDAWTETMQMNSFLGIKLHLIEDFSLILSNNKNNYILYLIYNILKKFKISS